MSTVAVNVMVDSDIKDKATAILKSLGLNKTSAINAFFRQVIFCKGLPFDLTIPNKLTLESIKDLESGKGISSDNVDEFLRETGICE